MILMKNIIALFLLLLLFNSCYKAVNNGVPDRKPKFSFSTYADDIYGTGGNIKDSLLTFTVNDSFWFNLQMSFSLISGNPSNYPITVYITGASPGLNLNKDS